MVRVPLAVLGLFGGLSAVFVAWPAISATTPQLKLSATNTVPSCVAPARLMQHVAKLNPKLDPKFREIASHYQTHGQSLGLRWDYAFFQMLADTNNLTFTGDVTKDHNNFAGIRTADGNEPDRFADVSTGVQAHLHHIRLYAGDPVAKPAAKRTKQVENFILSWSRQLKRPVRFDDMIGRWAPNNPGYARTIEGSLKDYQVAHCAGEVAALAAGDDTAKASADASARGTCLQTTRREGPQGPTCGQRRAGHRLRSTSGRRKRARPYGIGGAASVQARHAREQADGPRTDRGTQRALERSLRRQRAPLSPQVLPRRAQPGLSHPTRRRLAPNAKSGARVSAATSPS